MRVQLTPSSRWRTAFLSAAIFGVSTAFTYVAAQNGFRVSAVLIYLLGVTIIGATGGLLHGLFSALAGSAIYNFFLSEPVLQFGVTLAEESVPLIAFNLSALISGTLAGRLNDRVAAAERAEARITELFDLSRSLQEAVSVSDIAQALDQHAAIGSSRYLEMFVWDGARMEPVRSGQVCTDQINSGTLDVSTFDYAILKSSGEIIGAICLERSPENRADNDPLVNLLSLTLERCLLLEQRTAAEAVKQSERFKTALLSSLSHDMRTPLAAIAASASSLSSYGSDLDNDVRQRLLQTIEEQSQRLNRFTTDLLHLGRLDAGIGPDQLEAVDVIEILGTVLSSRSAGEDRARIEKFIETSSALTRANAAMLEQSFANIVDNFFIHAGQDSRLQIRLRMLDDDIEISFIDNGVGIAEADLPFIFDRFRTGESSERRSGQGLGLSIAKGFIEAFGGSLTVSNNAVGRGTQFNICLPHFQTPPNPGS